MNRARRLWAWVRLARPGNLLIAGVSIAAGALVSRADDLDAVLPIVLAGIFVAAAGNALNDFFDRRTDELAKPHRPIPAGDVRPAGALVFSSGLFLAGWGLAMAAGWQICALVSAWIVLLVLYSARLKRASLAGNLVVSAVVASAFFLGGLAGRDPLLSLIPAGLAFLFHLGREIIKDVQDREGDAATGVGTFAVRSGEGPALRLSAVVLVVLIAATIVPFLAGAYNRIYLGAVVLGVDLPLLFVIRTLLRRPSGERLGMVSGLLKADMIVGIACVLVGSGAV
jgi:geranylgeranylglycerol-phosphate geranylgeranyltransferase